ncbi:MAG: tetratricopeptide repeat protein [Chloroflexi bacterium]|nr:tetratricopeptide repeat protein [Chloroflexota bacterium]MBI3734662.1 tetratricopeptide repeat protein [Chloroflexota bacterium]
MPWLERLRARYHYALGLAQHSRGSRANSLAAYEEAIAELTVALEINPALTGAHYARGLIYWRELNDYERAVRDFTRALELDPQLARAYLNRGLSRVFGNIGTREEAIADFEQYLALDNNRYWRMEARHQIAQLKNG